MEDYSVWKHIQNNNKKAFKKVFNLYYKTLCSHICVYTKSFDTAEDIVQDTFIELWTNRAKIQIQTSLKAYLFKSAYNNYINNHRKQKRNDSLLETIKYQLLQEQFITQNDNILDQKVKKIRAQINILPEKCREILLLSKEKGLKNREIAEKLEISIKTVEAQIRIAYQKIRKGVE